MKLKMDRERDTLQRIDGLPCPRHLFSLTDWADPAVVDRLISEGYVDCLHQQRDENGQLLLAMGLQLTPKGKRSIRPKPNLPNLVFRGSLAGASFVGMSVVILYLG